MTMKSQTTIAIIEMQNHALLIFAMPFTPHALPMSDNNCALHSSERLRISEKYECAS
jgi:hypothetical protein